MILPRIAVVINWRNEENMSGLYSIHIRIMIGRSSRYYRVPIPQKVRLNQWSGEEGNWVRPDHPFSFEINSKILEKKTILHEQIKRNYNANKNVTFDSLIQHLERKGNRHSFFDYMESYIKRPPEKLEENTVKKYRTTLNHLQTFKKQIYFSDIDNDLLRDFLRYLQVDLELGGAAARKYTEALKKVIRKARRENFIDSNQMEFLFDGVKIKVPKAKRIFLEPYEIKALKEHSFTEEQRHLARDRDIFLFMIYTGYYYKDLFIFTKDQLLKDQEYGNIILGSRDKNGHQTIIPIFKFPYASIILKKYSSGTHSKTVFDLSHLIEEQVFNRHLKEIAKLAKINKSISNKVARHTNAQLWVRYGAEGAILSKMMGHTKQETTKHYYEVNIPEIVEGTKRADFKNLGI